MRSWDGRTDAACLTGGGDGGPDQIASCCAAAVASCPAFPGISSSWACADECAEVVIGKAYMHQLRA